MESINIVTFSYRIDDILGEITKRTTYMGKMRGTEQEPFLIDRLSLTKGEGFMFSEFLEEAVAETYDWLKAFGRNIQMYDKIVLKYEDIKLKDGVCLKLMSGDSEVAPNEESSLKCSIEAKGTRMDIRLGEVLSASTQEGYVINDAEPSIRVKIKVKYTNGNAQPVEKLYEKELKNGDELGMFSIYYESEEDEYDEDPTHPVEVTMVVVNTSDFTIKKNTYVEYHYSADNPDLFDVYQVNVDCTNINWKDYSCKLLIDPRDSIVFTLNYPDYFDLNMVSSIDRNIKEAIVNYIIYRWFEYVYPIDADKYYLKFEDYAHKAQLGMNSENTLLQRKYKQF